MDPASNMRAGRSDMSDQDIRWPLLKRLAEQAMSDAAFRAAARNDLDGALAEYGYDLNKTERPLVHRFRDSLAEAGVDLALVQELALDFEDDFGPDDFDRLETALREAPVDPARKP
jgi:hypothetical protein